MPVYAAPVRDTKYVLDHIVEMQNYSNLPGFADATPDLQSREVRNLPDRGDAPANSRPGSTSGEWEADADRD